MIDALSPRLPSSPRRSGGSLTPFFQTVRAKKIYRLSINFLRFPPFFETGVPLKKLPLSRSFFFAASRLRVNHLHPQGARRSLIDLTRRREAEKDMRLGETLVRLSEQMFILGANGLGFTIRRLCRAKSRHIAPGVSTALDTNGVFHTQTAQLSTLRPSVSRKPSNPAPNGSAQF